VPAPLVLAASQAIPAPFAAAGWVERLLIGPLGTSLAVIAVAWFGFGLLSGRLSVRRGGLLILGCFILFGAPSLARGLLGLAGETGGARPMPVPQTITPPPPAVPSPPAFDPYAGASVPQGN
jgi:type IV secretory pathway VirB2 component (pilin)